MVSWILVLAATAYFFLWLRAWLSRDLSSGPYLSPDEADAEIVALAEAYPDRCHLEVIGHSTEGRPIRALRVRGAGSSGAGRARLLVTAQIHAIEYVGAAVARAVARRLLEDDGRDAEVTGLLDRADVWVVPLLNPDGAHRVWGRGGWVGLGAARFSAGGVDPNRNFPFRSPNGARAWNSGRARAGSPYYRGPHPLSEPECLALARLGARERFCGAINFHSFGAVVYLPAVSEAGPDRARLRETVSVFQGEFQWRQPHVRYRPIAERSAAIQGQLDAFLVDAFGTASVTIEVSRPGWHVLRPDRLGNAFWIANPARPAYWVENDRDAAIHGLCGLLDRSGGEPVEAPAPELANAIGAASPPALNSS